MQRLNQHLPRHRLELRIFDAQEARLKWRSGPAVHHVPSCLTDNGLWKGWSSNRHQSHISHTRRAAASDRLRRLNDCQTHSSASSFLLFTRPLSDSTPESIKQSKGLIIGCLNRALCCCVGQDEWEITSAGGFIQALELSGWFVIRSFRLEQVRHQSTVEHLTVP